MYGERFEEATRLFNSLPVELQSLTRALRVTMVNDYKVAAEAMSIDELKEFGKHECHMILWAELKARVTDLPDLVCENETFWWANAVNNQVQSLIEKRQQKAPTSDGRKSARQRLAEIVATPISQGANAIRRRLGLGRTPSSTSSTRPGILRRTLTEESLDELLSASQPAEGCSQSAEGSPQPDNPQSADTTAGEGATSPAGASSPPASQNSPPASAPSQPSPAGSQRPSQRRSTRRSDRIREQTRQVTKPKVRKSGLSVVPEDTAEDTVIVPDSQQTTQTKNSKNKKKKKAETKKDVTVVRCILCMSWHETNESEAGAWCCPSCRTMSQTVNNILGEIRGLRRDLQKMEKNNSDLQGQLSAKTVQCDQLLKENATLKQQLTGAGSKQKDQDYSKTLLLGSSIVRDAKKMCNTDKVQVESISGGTVTDVQAKLCSLQGPFNEIVLAVGGNDCCKSDADPSTIARNYQTLINTATSKAREVKVSSILPRNINDPRAEVVIADVNDQLRDICTSEGVGFVDHSPKFTLSDGTLNDALLLDDGVHLTNTGTRKVLQALGLEAVSHQPSTAAGSAPRYGQDRGRSSRPPAKGQQNSQSSRPNCFKCGEHHATKDCRRQSRVTCYNCGRPGHLAHRCRV